MHLPPPTIRAADPERDAAAITAIYAHHVLHGTGTFEETPPDLREMRERMTRVVGRCWPWIVAEDASGILGFAYAAQFRERSAYRYSAEDSIYIRADAVGRGIGRVLLATLVDRSRMAGFRFMYAVIGDAENIGSIRLHEALGFEHAGVLKQIGFKFGRYLDVVFMQRAIG